MGKPENCKVRVPPTHSCCPDVARTSVTTSITITAVIGIFCIVCACPPITSGNDDALCNVRPRSTKTHLVQPFVVRSRKARGPQAPPTCLTKHFPGGEKPSRGGNVEDPCHALPCRNAPKWRHVGWEVVLFGRVVVWEALAGAFLQQVLFSQQT
jgi:hypothetical protein